MKVYLPEMSFAEVEDILDQVQLAILPTGSNEGHGPHLPLKVDAATSTYVACKAAEALYPQILVTPCLAVGHSPQHLEFPGSMTLRWETQVRVLMDYCQSLMGYGIRRFALVNGHGNNMAVNAQAARQITEELGVAVASFAYWETSNSRSRFWVLIYRELRAFPGIVFADFFPCFPGFRLFCSLSGSGESPRGVRPWESYGTGCQRRAC